MKTYDIMINDLNWTVRFLPYGDEALVSGDDECYGLTEFSKLTINVCDQLPPQLIERTLRHELTHAYLFSNGIDGDGMDEEAVCNFVEAFGLDIMFKARMIMCFVFPKEIQSQLQQILL